MRSARGASLVELVVAMAVGSIVLSMAAYFVMFGSRVSTRVLVRIGIEKQTIHALNLIVADLEQTVKLGISLLPNDGSTSPVSLCIIRIASTFPDGRQQFETHPVVYVWDGVGGSLVRKVVDETAVGLALKDTTPIPIPVPMQQSLQAAPGVPGTDQVLARGVTAFSISHGGTAKSIDQPFTITMQMQQNANTGSVQAESFQATRTVSLRDY